MAPPVIDTVQTPVEPREAFLVTGSNFGFVNGTWFVDAQNNAIPATYFQLIDSQRCIVTVPPDITTNADYTIEFATLEDEVSVNNAGLVHVDPLSGNVTPVQPLPTPNPFPLPAPGVNPTLDRVRARARLELSDRPQPFSASVRGDGTTMMFDLPVRHVNSEGLIVARYSGGDFTQPAEMLATTTDYVLDDFMGTLTLNTPLADGDVLVVRGIRYRFFNDVDLDQFIETAFVQITHGRKKTTTNISQFGYRQYTEFDFTYGTIPEVEIYPTALLAAIQAKWVLVSDSAYDIDIGGDTNIPRSERYRQLMGQISADTARFDEMARYLNIGIKRIEVTTLRRVSKMTGRLIPVYVDKEYDDHNLPIRVLPGVDHASDEGDEFIDPYYISSGSAGGGFGP